MGLDLNSAYKPSLGRITGDTSDSDGAGIISVPEGTTIAPKANYSLHIQRFFGRITGDWTLYSWDGSAKTTMNLVFEGGTAVEIPGLDIKTPVGTVLRVVAAGDATPELYVEYGYVKTVYTGPRI